MGKNPYPDSDTEEEDDAGEEAGEVEPGVGGGGGEEAESGEAGDVGAEDGDVGAGGGHEDENEDWPARARAARKCRLDCMNGIEHLIYTHVEMLRSWEIIE